MKLIKEHIILEKFTEDSDPIRDLGIGMANKLKKFLDEKGFIKSRYESAGDISAQLAFCAQHKQFDLVNFLLDDPNINLNYLNGIAFRWIAHTDNTELLQKFLDKGIDVNIYRKTESALNNAIHSNKYKSVILLVKNGAIITRGNLNDAKEINKQMFDFLKKHNKQIINEVFTQDSDPIQDMGIGIAEQIKKFMKEDIEEYNYESDATTTDKNIILGYSVIYEKEDFVDYLLKKGANINSVDVKEWFYFACRYGHTECIKLLIKKGFDIHGNASIGWERGLRLAIIHSNLDIVKLLVEAGADIHVVDDKPIKLAIANNDLDILEYFYEKGVKFNKKLIDIAVEYASSKALNFMYEKRKEEKRKKLDKFTKFFKLKENLNEKFTEDSDPIKDLGIGSKFSRIKVGDVLILKKNMDMSPKDNRILLFDTSGTDFLRKGHAATVCTVLWEGSILELRIAFFNKIETALSIRDQAIRGHNMGYYKNIGRAPIEKWEEYFKVYEIR